MKIKTQDLIGEALDWAVAKAEGNVRLQYDNREGLIIQNILGWFPYRPSLSWQQGGPIIEREEIFLAKSILGGWTGSIMTHDERVRCTMHEGPTPLIAAMRCYVASKLGEELDIPEELV